MWVKIGHLAKGYFENCLKAGFERLGSRAVGARWALIICRTITRRACEDDLSGIMNLHQDARSHEPHIWKVYLELEPDSGIVAETDGSMSGCVHVYLHRETGWIEGLYVHPRYRGAGVGKKLLEEAFSLIRAESGKLALIDALMDNMPAIRLYHKLGFENVYVRSH